MKDIFSVVLTGSDVAEQLEGVEYDFLADGKKVPDAYARAVAGREKFGKKQGKVRGCMDFADFDWSGENWRRLPVDEMILYQCHVRGFTRHASSGVEFPGTFAGLQEKIPYLKELGVNTLLLLPVYDFNEKMEQTNEKGEKKTNYWGYTGDAFYLAPKAGYCSGRTSPSTEFKSLIKALHQNGMNIVLDMYFVGRTPEFILQCLRYYALNFHIDGFRINQDCMDTRWLHRDPLLSHVKLLGNNWGEQPAGGSDTVCMEMNDGFLIDARRYMKSDEGQTENFYRRFREQRNGVGVIHYITQNNGFTLRDLISYDVKHNEANGERNQDGTEYNYSWNCGAEGPTRRKAVLRMRQKQERNAFVMLLLGLAVPMLLAGDEFGNSQKGNNNAYCQDNSTTWLNWRLLDKNRETFDFARGLIAFRKNHPLYHQEKNFTGMDNRGLGAPDVSCHGKKPWVTDFSYYSRELGILYYGGYFGAESLYFVFNFHWDSHDFYLPTLEAGQRWRLLLDTSVEEREKEAGYITEKYRMAPRSIAVFEGVCTRPGKSGRRKKNQ